MHFPFLVKLLFCMPKQPDFSQRLSYSAVLLKLRNFLQFGDQQIRNWLGGGMGGMCGWSILPKLPFSLH